MTTRTVFDLAADCEALSTIYAEACGRHASAQARHEAEPDVACYRERANDSRIAMDNVLARLLAACNELRDAGAGLVAANIFLNADRNATLAQTLAFKAELSTMKGAA